MRGHRRRGKAIETLSLLYAAAGVDLTPAIQQDEKGPYLELTVSDVLAVLERQERNAADEGQEG